MIPAICILHCQAIASPHVHALLTRMLNAKPQVTGSYVNWATVILDLASVAALAIGIIVAICAIQSMRRELRKLQVLA